ncbi:30S ribosome-binding factor RbfA [Candidatus Ishikawella capsulata]|uniref:Ribosome-binding factor A n=1 Tax=Candidatus Ishikawaella capsulata Mpkobe TaxID=476281 RepID=C5WCU2_9ENTR|nr:30S ribosome-binding factor RbfA [Candidatus Ishikawaella capsulata]BAH83148.1 ribosome-binding factor A [Candidatus Ishikawaella capsulata Mpkobe]
MLKTFNRSQRISQQLQKEIAIILQREIQDPRLHMLVTVSSVEVSRDFAYAKIFVTFCNLVKDENIVPNGLEALKDASGYIRKLLSKNMYMRIVPILNFFHDQSVMNGIYMDNLISNISKNRRYYEGTIRIGKLGK